MGLARRLLEDRGGAYGAFARAYRIAPDEIEVGRNLALQCIAIGYGEEAVAVSKAMVKLAPDDAGLAANYALALLISGDVNGALREVKRAQKLDAYDDVTQNLRILIENVLNGKVERPSKI